jgi:hypothetical protein
MVPGIQGFVVLLTVCSGIALAEDPMDDPIQALLFAPEVLFHDRVDITMLGADKEALKLTQEKSNSGKPAKPDSEQASGKNEPGSPTADLKQTGLGQSAAAALGDFYRPDEVQSVYLRVAEEDLQRMLAALPERIYVPASFRWRDISVENVAIRFKGNSSSHPNQPHKRSYLIKFNKYDDDVRFFGLRRVSFDNGIQFGSLFSEPIITDILRDHGIKTHRCNYARVYLNEKYQGVYVNVERIDESFIEHHLPDSNGLLFKVDEGGPGANLQFLGDDPSAYKRAFEAKTESAEKEPARLVEFIRLINQSEKSDFAAMLESKMELNDFLGVTAVMLLSGAFDQLTGWNPHNYYLYHDVNHDRWRYLPWDLDVGFCETAFGQVHVLADWNAAWPVATSGAPNPLLERIIADPVLLQRYRGAARTILDKSFQPERLCGIIDAKYKLIKQDLQVDPFPHRRATVPGDRSYDDIVESIKEFVRRRHASALGQLENPGPRPEVVRRPPGGQPGNRPPGLPPQLAGRIQRIQQRARRMQQDGQDISPIHKVMQRVGPLVQQGKFKEAAAVLDRGLEVLTKETNSEPDVRHKDESDTGQQLSSGHGQSRTTFNFARSLAADESGRLHAVWQTTRDGRSRVYYRRSPNDGKTWENAQQLSADEASHEHPSIAVSGNDVFVVWHGFRSANMPVVYLRRSNDGGREWDDARIVCDSGTAAHASLAVVHKTVHLIWKDHRDGDTEVYYRRSVDAGQTFEAERRLTDAPVISYVPSLAASGQVVVLAWVDTRDGNEEEYIKVSTDGGTTWGADTRMTDDRKDSWAPSVAVAGRTIHLVWFDQKDAPYHVYDAEAKLDEALRLVGLQPASPPAGVHIPDPEQIARLRATEKMKKIQAESPQWINAGGDREKLQRIMQEFDEMGQPVGLLAEAEKALDRALVLIGARLAAPEQKDKKIIDAIQRRMQAKIRKVQQRGPKWVAEGGDPRDLQAAMSQFEQAVQHAQHTGSYVNKERKLDEALKLMNISFTPKLPDKLPVKHYGEVLPSRVQAKQQDLRAAAPQWVQQGGSQKQLEGLLREFERRMKIAQLEWDVYYRRSDDAGKTWSDELHLIGVPGLSHRPNLAAFGSELHLVWWDNRQGNDEVHYKHSADGGRTWGTDIRLTYTAAASQFPMVAITKSGPHVIWTERRDGLSQVFYKRPEK